MKPRLYASRTFTGAWVCDDGTALGVGDTLLEAYEDWQAELTRRAQQEVELVWV